MAGALQWLVRVLLTNDDGIRAPGLAALFEALADPAGRFGGPISAARRGEPTRSPRSVVWPVAPLTVQSATSHGVTFHEPLMVRDEVIPVSGGGMVTGVAVDGRPADCVKLAICRLWPERFGEGAQPDLVISGMNAGANVGINVIYSGTVAAALEAAFLGVPSVAVSLHIGAGRPRFETAAAHARAALDALLAAGPLRPHDCLSVNIPVTEEDGPTPPIRVCPMNTHGLIDSYQRRVSPAGDPYYWPDGHGLNFRTTDAGTDVAALFDGCITVTPLRYDLTQADRLDHWRERLAPIGRS